MLQHSAHGRGTFWKYCERGYGEWRIATSIGSPSTLPWMIAPGLFATASRTVSSHCGGGRQSSSVKTTVGADASVSAALRLAPGGAVPAGRRVDLRTPASASGGGGRGPRAAG